MGAGKVPIMKKRNTCDKCREIHVSQSIKRPIQDMVEYEKGDKEKERYLQQNFRNQFYRIKEILVTIYKSNSS